MGIVIPATMIEERRPSAGSDPAKDLVFCRLSVEDVACAPLDEVLERVGVDHRFIQFASLLPQVWAVVLFPQPVEADDALMSFQPRLFPTVLFSGLEHVPDDPRFVTRRFLAIAFGSAQIARRVAPLHPVLTTAHAALDRCDAEGHWVVLADRPHLRLH
jgi:hypothetical protein